MAGNPNTSGFVNWSRYFNANKSEAEESAEKARAEGEKKAQAAQGSRSALQQEFRDKAGIQPTQSLRTNVGTGAVGGGWNANVGTGAMRTQVTAPAPAPAQDMSVGGLRASAQASRYGGPDGLAQLDGYGNALAQEKDALGRATALNSASGRSTLLQDAGATAGEGRLGAALQGQAGGEGFRGLKDYFRGDTLSEANDASVLEAEGAKQMAADKRTALNAQADAKEDLLAEEARSAVALDNDNVGKGVDPLGDLGGLLAQYAGKGPNTEANKPPWGQVNFYGALDLSPEEFLAGGDGPAAHASQFSMAGGQQGTWEAMSNEEYQAFENLWSQAIRTPGDSAQRKQVFQLVKLLNRKYGGG